MWVKQHELGVNFGGVFPLTPKSSPSSINARSFYIPMINLMIFFATKFLVETKSRAKPNLVAENHLVA